MCRGFLLQRMLKCSCCCHRLTAKLATSAFCYIFFVCLCEPVKVAKTYKPFVNLRSPLSGTTKTEL